MNTINPIRTNLLTVSASVTRSLKVAELMSMAIDFEHPQEALQTRLLLSILGKLMDWNAFEGTPIEASSIGNWTEISPKIRTILQNLEGDLQSVAPSLTFEHLELVESQFMNEFIIRNQNIVEPRLLVLKVLLHQLTLLNVIKQKTMVSQILMAYFDTFLNDYKSKKTTNAVQIKRILHILISKNFLNDDSTHNSTFMFNFNQTFSEIIEIITKVRNLEFTNKMFLQVVMDYPSVYENNVSVRDYYDQFSVNQLDLEKLELKANPKLEKADFRFDVVDRVYNLFVDRHAKHKIFCESVEEFNVKRLLRNIQSILGQIEGLNGKLKTGHA